MSLFLSPQRTSAVPRQLEACQSSRLCAVGGFRGLVSDLNYFKLGWL